MSAPAIPSFDEFVQKQPAIPTFEEFSKQGGAPAQTAAEKPWIGQPRPENEGMMSSIFHMPVYGLQDIGTGIKHMMQPGNRMQGAHEAFSGAGRLALPFALGPMAAAPLATLAAGAGGLVGSEAAKGIARTFNASPQAEQLAGDVGSLPGAVLGGKVGGLASKAAEPLARGALGIPRRAEAYGANPGKAILEETRGVRPETIGDSARARLGQLSTELENRASQSKTPATLEPARSVVRDAIAKAGGGNSEKTPTRLQPQLDQLTKVNPGFNGATQYAQGANTPVSFVPGKASPIVGPNGQPVSTGPTAKYGPTPEPRVATEQSPADLLKMKRQFNEDFITNWNPVKESDAQLATAKQAHHELGSELERTVPGASALNQRISSLIPVARGAKATELSAGPGERILNRVSRPTGGMLPVVFGYSSGGASGAAEALGLQEALSSPAVKMIGARGLHAAGKPLGVVPAATVGAASR